MFERQPIRPATDEEKTYIKAMAIYAIDETIETDEVSIFWSEPETSTIFSTQHPTTLQVPKVNILKGHISPETAYLVNDYPYGFRLRCKIRYWLEHDSRKGTRFISQTTNPKIQGREVWNKPKASTYAYIAGCMFLDEQDHIQWTGLTEYSDIKESKEWLETYGEGLPEAVLERVKTWIQKKEAFQKTLDEGKVKITISSGYQEA